MPLRPAFLTLLALLPLAEVAAQQAAPWQQEVAYDIDLTLFADRHRFEGRQRLAYTNNSPDTLRQVFYHLYFNAFHPGSLMAERNRHLPDPDGRVVPRIFELGPDEVGYQRVRSLTQDGQTTTWRVHDTVLEVALAAPLLPGGTTVLEMDFEGQVPLQTRRSGRDSREGVRFSMAQWYPKLAAYDALGWHPHPYIGREFYAPFGTFDVRLTLPADYVVGATGTLQNPEAVGHGYDTPADAGRVATGPALRADGTRPDSLTWHFRAEAVHDFAWAADPRYVHERHLVTDVPGRTEPVAIHLLYLPDVAAGWRPMGEWMRQMTRFFSERYGPYPYPQFTVAQGADGGMEYPMFTLITGRRPAGSLFSVTAHEFAHMWWYGVVATNESLYSWIDEGFTNYATTEAQHAILFGRAGPASHANALEAVARAQRLGFYERPNKPADWYDTNAGFSVAAYSAGQAFVSLLGYVMGDAVRDHFLYRFGTEWRFRHPYPADIQKLAQDVSGMHLNWLFDQFLTGAEPYDYAATGLRTERTAGGYRSEVTLARRTPGVLPQDVRVRFADGTERWVHVPLAEAFGHKPVPEGWLVAEPWPWVHPTYTLTLDGASPAVEAIVDPAYRTPDVDRSNNRVARGPNVVTRFDGVLRPPTAYADARGLAASPIVTYSDRLGIGLGAQVRAVGPYARRTAQLGVTLYPQAISDPDRGLPPGPIRLPPIDPDLPLPGWGSPSGTWHDGVDYTVRLRAQPDPRGGAATLEAVKALGILENRLSFSAPVGPRRPLAPAAARATLTLGHQHRTTDRAFPYLSPAALGGWGGEEALFGREHMLSARVDLEAGEGADRLAAFVELGSALRDRGPFWDGPTSANRVGVTAARGLRFGPAVLHARAAAALGAEALAPQKRFRVGGATPETRWREAGFRVPAAAFPDPRSDFHFVAFSGYGPVAPLLATPQDALPATHLGNALLAGTLAFEVGPPRIPGADPETQGLLDPLRFEVFSGVGTAFRTGTGAPPWLGDAGLGLRYDLGAAMPLAQVARQSDVLSGLRLAARFPLWVSDPAAIGEDRAFGFRWLIGVETGL